MKDNAMELRNIAIIAHVDHGKTTLVDALLKQSGTFRDNQKVQECAMDSNELERERGITILSKCTSVEWNGTRINIVDTPGHADFGGEVERILSMVDGVILLVDSSEGPMPQTKFVLGKALKVGLKPIVVINKADKPDARVDEVLNEIFDLFVSLDADDEQLDFPVLYASGRNGWAVKDLEHDEKKDLKVLFELILSHVPAPVCYPEKPFTMLATTLEADKFIGRLLTGKILCGSVKPGDTVKALDGKNNEIERFRITKILAYRGLARQSLEEAHAGDIVAIAGAVKATVADTVCDFSVTEALEAQPIDPPTLVMTFSVNDSPLAGREGDKVTSRMIAERLKKEAEGNIALKITTSPNNDSFEVAGRGELRHLADVGRLGGLAAGIGVHLGIKDEDIHIVAGGQGENGEVLEPVDEVVVDVDEEFSGTVVEKLGSRRAELVEMIPSQAGGKVRLIFHAPTRGLIGYHSEFLTDTHGTGVMNRSFYDYEPFKGEIEGRRNGVLISSENGTAIAYSLWKLEDRGPMFIDPNVPVYVGMIIGEHTKPNDLEINPCRSKQLTNIRAAGKDEAISLTPPRRITLEEGLSYIQEDELLEVTPKTIRLRKRILDPILRKRSANKIA